MAFVNNDPRPIGMPKRVEDNNTGVEPEEREQGNGRNRKETCFLLLVS